MTDRIRHLTITLDRDYRDDDVTSIISAIQQIRGVTDVLPRIVSLPDVLAASRVEGEIRIALHEAIESVFAKAAKRP